MVMGRYHSPHPPRPAFELSGGHPALDFVNTLDDRFAPGGPSELLKDYGDLVRFALQTKLLQPSQARSLASAVEAGTAARVLRAARELREALAATFYACLEGRSPAVADVGVLERHFHAAYQRLELRWHTAGMSWQWGQASQAELPLWALARAASELLLSGARERVRACGAQSCRWLFLDTSKNHTRRWCNMRVCGNRMKARRFHARHADAHRPRTPRSRQH